MTANFWATARINRNATLLLAAISVSACSGSAGTRTDTSPQPVASTTTNAEIEAIYRARMDSARSQFTEADVHFMTGMIHHHAQALVMAAMAPTHGASASVQTLCARIINAQRDEIVSMQRWLRDRGQLVPEVDASGRMAMMHGESSMHMPGMLTADQLEELDESRGQEFDRAFLTFMIQHHRGAVTMVHDLFATDGAALDETVFKLASDVQVDQLTEIARMELMLDALPAARRL